MTRRIFASALFAGLTAGIVAAVLQLFLVTPVLLEGERYESGELTHFAGAAPAVAPHEHDAAGNDIPADPNHAEAAGHSHGADEEGSFAARVAMTFFMDLVIYTGFALVLAAAFAFAAQQGLRVDARHGLLWGLAGFAAVQLAPSLGLPPELPGTPAADVSVRQIWWSATVAATALGLALMVWGNTGLRVAGLLVIAVPHLIGAPVLPYHGGSAPPELAGLFVARALVTGAVAWAALGLAAGWFWTRNEGLA